MNEDFITKGIENDRYQKALRLVDQFEEEMVTEIRNVAKDTITRRPDLFVDDASPRKSVNLRRTNPIGNMRMDTTMRRVNNDDERLILNIAIEWAKPEAHGHEEPTDGTLCIVLYKVKNCPRANYEQVKQRTQSRPKWDLIQFDDDLWNSDYGIFYVPVRNGPEVKQGLQTLQEHFLEFGEAFGELPADEAV